jgi:hypothetical protein
MQVDEYSPPKEANDEKKDIANMNFCKFLFADDDGDADIKSVYGDIILCGLNGETWSYDVSFAYTVCIIDHAEELIPFIH